jgi:hypothetical protein
MVALNRNSCRFGRITVNMPKMTGVQIPTPVRTLACVHKAVPAGFPRPGSVRPASANFVANKQP